MRERVEAMKAIWTEDEAEYHGKHVDFDPIWSWPKPVQPPHPPILVGGNGKTVAERVLAFGDEWMPNRFGDDEKFTARIEKLSGAGARRRGATSASRSQSRPLDPGGDRAATPRPVCTAASGTCHRGTAMPVERALDRYAAAVHAFGLERAGRHPAAGPRQVRPSTARALGAAVE